MPYSRLVKFCFYSFTVAQIISIFGDRLHQFSVVGMIGKIDPGSSVELFQLGLFSYLPILIFAPVFGTLIDRANKALVLVIVDLIRGVLVLLIPALYYVMGNLYAFYIPVFVLSLANLWFAPAKSAIIPEVFGTSHLLHVNALLWGLGIVGTLAGFVLGGWLFDFHSWQLSFYSDGASYLISVLFLLPLIAVASQRSRTAVGQRGTTKAPPHTTGLVTSIRLGLELIRGKQPVAFSLVVQMLLFAVLGVLYVIGVARIQSVFPPDKTMYLSAVASAATIGLLVGSGVATLARR
ncbi:MAG: MFS transporter, partial [Candidatus Krumholzibacteria bacterium]|nr:MFS transporter [Candidatus Krumholzibacteria bacterium]